jgi:hypothetical protein
VSARSVVPRLRGDKHGFPLPAFAGTGFAGTTPSEPASFIRKPYDEIVHPFPQILRTNFSNAASCALTMSMVGWSVSSSVFSSNFFAAKLTITSGRPNQNTSTEMSDCRR